MLGLNRTISTTILLIGLRQLSLCTVKKLEFKVHLKAEVCVMELLKWFYVPLSSPPPCLMYIKHRVQLLEQEFFQVLMYGLIHKVLVCMYSH